MQKNYGFNANQDIFVLVNNNYIKLIFGEDENGNVYGSDRVSKVANKEAFDLENSTYYVNTGGQFIEITTNNLFIENSKIEKTNLSKAAFQASGSLIGNININEGALSLVYCNFNKNSDISINEGNIYLTLKDDQILKRKI